MKRKASFCLLILFLLSLCDGTLSHAASAQTPASEGSAQVQEILPVALKYRQQILDEVRAPLLSVAYLSAPDLPTSPAFFEKALLPNGRLIEPAADPLYVLMSLQR